jgi:hypothetical protein
MNAESNSARLAEDLAGAWTDAALELLRRSGVPEISVAMELETWRIITNILRSEMRLERGFHLRPFLTALDLKEQVLFRATLLARGQFASRNKLFDLDDSFQSLVRGKRLTSIERELYWEAFQAKRSTRRTDYFPKVGAAAIGG